MCKKYALLVLFLAFLLIMPNFSFGATNVEMQIQSLMAQIQALQQQLVKLQAQQGSDREWCHTFNTNLKIGDTGDEVRALGIVLTKEGFGRVEYREGLIDPISDDGVFIEETAAAVTGFQQKYKDEILTPLGLKYGTGYVGKSTRAKLNKLYGCEITKPPTSAGYLEIDPSSASIAVGGSVSMQAMYQPPMPKCSEGFACPQVMPARYPVVAEWTSSNPKVASIDVIGSCAAIGCPVPTTVLIKGVSSGTADIKAAYKSPPGTFLTATAKVVVGGSTNTNNLPVINGIPAIPSSIKVDQSVLFSWGATDADGDNLSWSVSWGDGTGMAGACQSPNQQNKQGWNFSASHAWAKSGTYTVKATANDCRGGSNEHTFNVTVGSISIAPAITVLSPNGGEAPSQQLSGTEALCPFPSSWLYVSDNSLRTVEGDNLSPWNIVGDPTLLYDQNKFRMWYTAADGRVNADGSGNGGIAYAESTDGIQWNVWKENNSPAGVIDLVLKTSSADWDGAGVETASVMRTPSGEYRMYYTGNRPPEGSNHYSIGLATSNDGIHWTKYGKGPIFEPKNQWELPTCTNPNDPRSCSNGGVLEPSVLYDAKEKIYKMWYAGVGTKDNLLTFRIGYATSPDGIKWKQMPEPVLDRGKDGEWNDVLVSQQNVIYDPQSGYHLFYFGVKFSEYCDNCVMQPGRIGHAYSTDGIRWQQDPRNPILSPRKDKWDEWAIGGPAVIARGGELLLWYFGNKKQDSISESGIGFVKAACQNSQN